MFNEKVVILIKKASLEFDKIANPILQNLNLTAAQYKIVKYLLLHQNENVIQQDLEKFFSLTHPTTIELLEKLEEKGFVTKIKNPSDGRSRIVRLTVMAISKRDDLIEVGNILESKMTEGLTEAETKQLMKLLEKMLSGINKSNKKEVTKMTLKEAVYERHTVRKYTSESIAADKVELLKNRIKENNEKFGLNIELVTNNADGIPGFAKLVFAKGVNNYFVLAGKDSSDLDEKLGYCGSDLMLYAQTLGLNTWWIGFTYNKKSAAKNVPDNVKVNGIITVGYGQNSGVQHKMKTAQDISSYDGEAPEWFKSGVDALLHAPTAMNKIMYTVKGSGNKVSITCNNGNFSGIDLGIGKHHFEIGAGKENFEWE